MPPPPHRVLTRKDILAEPIETFSGGEDERYFLLRLMREPGVKIAKRLDDGSLIALGITLREKPKTR